MTQECSAACELPLLQATPKLQKDVLKYPDPVEKKIKDLEDAALGRKKEIEERMQKLKEIEESLDNFIDELARNQKNFDRQATGASLDPADKRDLIDDFEKTRAALQKTLDKIKLEVEEMVSDVEDTPFLMRRIQEATQKLDDFALA